MVKVAGLRKTYKKKVVKKTKAPFTAQQVKTISKIASKDNEVKKLITRNEFFSLVENKMSTYTAGGVVHNGSSLNWLVPVLTAGTSANQISGWDYKLLSCNVRLYIKNPNFNTLKIFTIDFPSQNDYFQNQTSIEFLTSALFQNANDIPQTFTSSYRTSLPFKVVNVQTIRPKTSHYNPTTQQTFRYPLIFNKNYKIMRQYKQPGSSTAPVAGYVRGIFFLADANQTGDCHMSRTYYYMDS